MSASVIAIMKKKIPPKNEKKLTKATALYRYLH